MGAFMELSIIASSGLGPLWTVVVLLVVGLVALAVELLILPGFGVAGVLGIASLLAGIIMAWIKLGAFWGGVTVAATLVITIVMFVVLFKSKMMRKRLVLDAHLMPRSGTASVDFTWLVGKEGEAATDLRPAGIAGVDGVRLDVVSDGGYIDKGTKIKVVEIDGPRVIVARID